VTAFPAASATPPSLNRKSKDFLKIIPLSKQTRQGDSNAPSFLQICRVLPEKLVQYQNGALKRDHQKASQRCRSLLCDFNPTNAFPDNEKHPNRSGGSILVKVNMVRLANHLSGWKYGLAKLTVKQSFQKGPTVILTSTMIQPTTNESGRHTLELLVQIISTR